MHGHAWSLIIVLNIQKQIYVIDVSWEYNDQSWVCLSLSRLLLAGCVCSPLSCVWSGAWLLLRGSVFPSLPSIGFWHFTGTGLLSDQYRCCYNTVHHSPLSVQSVWLWLSLMLFQWQPVQFHLTHSRSNSLDSFLGRFQNRWILLSSHPCTVYSWVARWWLEDGTPLYLHRIHGRRQLYGDPMTYSHAWFLTCA